MTQQTVVPVILCGGSGTRLWPLSRAGFPKQFLVLVGEHSLFQQAVYRASGVMAEDILSGPPLIVTNEEHRFLALEQLREAGVTHASLLLEPAGRNTAPALTLAALHAMRDGADPVLVVSPSDHHIPDSVAYTVTVQNAVRVAASGAIVTLGITPDRPATGYGYIQYGTSVGTYSEHDVIRFKEKPDLASAQALLRAGQHVWNSGLFVLKASAWLAALAQFRPDIRAATEAAWQGRAVDGAFIRPDKVAFESIPPESIDYAVMEKCPGSAFPLKMTPLNAGWNDLGSWDVVWQIGKQDANGNVTQGDVLTTGSTNTLVHASHRLVSAVGVENLIIVETADAVLVAHRERSESVKEIVASLQNTKREEHNLHRKVPRPWGWYDSVDEGERFKVKRIQVKPGASLSLQKHHHRAEHWIVVKGVAEVTCGERVFRLGENQSTFIPLGEIHRLANPGDEPLEIIEVQSGGYLGEDDIVRFEDRYGRGDVSKS